MPHLDPRSLARFVDGLGVVFYVAMAAALLTAVAGSPGWATLMLILGAAALVVRTALESMAPRGTASG
jgi:hypothetical protein